MDIKTVMLLLAMLVMTVKCLTGLGPTRRATTRSNVSIFVVLLQLNTLKEKENLSGCFFSPLWFINKFLSGLHLLQGRQSHGEVVRDGACHNRHPVFFQNMLRF